MVIRSKTNSHTRGTGNMGFFFAFLCICSSIYIAFLLRTATNKKDVTAKKLLATHVLSSNTSNVVFSPLSIDTVLRSVAEGSTEETLKQLLSYLKAKSIDDVYAYLKDKSIDDDDDGLEYVSSVLDDGTPFGGPVLRYANEIWVERTLFRPYFKDARNSRHKVACKIRDFRNKPNEVADEVNMWAEKQSSGLIKDVVPADAVSDQPAILFANALYFKGVWKEKFDRSMTKLHDFDRLDGSTVQVPYMTTNSKQILRQYDGFKVLGLPYEQGEDKRRFTMYFYLPDKQDGLQSLVEKIDSESDFFESYIPSEKVDVEEVMIPKFKISYGFEASDMLKELGLVSPFIPGGLTNITMCTRGDELFISSIYHKSVVEVNEDGTEAAAATFTGLTDGIKMEFFASHPFLFVIREDTSRTVMFVGQVVDPSVS